MNAIDVEPRNTHIVDKALNLFPEEQRKRAPILFRHIMEGWGAAAGDHEFIESLIAKIALARQLDPARQDHERTFLHCFQPKCRKALHRLSSFLREDLLVLAFNPDGGRDDYLAIVQKMHAMLVLAYYLDMEYGRARAAR